jgi:HlyD family secretion protein
VAPEIDGEAEMSEPLIREEALSQLDNLENLNSALRITSPLSWLTIWTLTAGLALLVAWSVFVRVPIQVQGQGMLVAAQGVLQHSISAINAGEVSEILVEEGEKIKVGQVVAHLHQPAKEELLRQAREKLASSKQQYEELIALQRETTEAQTGLHKDRRVSLAESIAQLKQREEWLRKRQGSQERIYQKGYLTLDRLLSSRAELATALEQISDRRNQLTSIEVEETTAFSEREHERLSLVDRRREIEREIDGLTEALARESNIRSAHPGEISEIIMSVGDIVSPGLPVMSVVPVQDADGTVAGRPPGLMGILYIARRDGKKIKPGLEVLVDPSTVRKDEFGLIRARVEEVSDVPATVEGMHGVLHNKALVGELSAAGAPFEVEVSLVRDPETFSGFEWTSTGGPQVKVTAGTMFTADVTTERVRLITLVLPALKQMFRAE